MSVVVQPELPHAVLVELLRLVDAALSCLACCQRQREAEMRKQMMRQKDLFEEAVTEGVSVSGDASGSGGATGAADAVG